MHIGEFLTGTQAEVMENVATASNKAGYQDPTQTLPVPPPTQCYLGCGKCGKCAALKLWEQQYAVEVDDLISKSNVHHCSGAAPTDRLGNGVGTKIKRFVGCLDNKWGKCKA